MKRSLRLELSRFQLEQDKLAYAELKAQVDRMRPVSPIAAEVHEVTVKAGEAVDAQEDVLRVIDAAKLWIDVPVPVGEGRRLLLAWEKARVAGQPLSQTARVRFPLAKEAGETEAASRGGVILFVAKEADAASDTLQVRVEVERPASA